MRLDCRLIFALLAAGCAQVAVAAPRLDPSLADHAVLQRERPIHVSGQSGPREQLTVRLANRSVSARADQHGRWSVDLPALPAGGPYRVEVKGAAGAVAVADDVMIGDVWLCSGQSNMEYPLRRTLNGDAEVQGASDPDLRLLKVAHQLSPSPRTRFEQAPSWQAATPDSAKDFSAACYFMARDLRATEKVPVGAIDASWGGTPIRAWMDQAAVRSSGGGAASAIVDVYRHDPTQAVRMFGREWAAWWRSRSGDAAGQEPWNASDKLNWSPVPSLAYWDSWGPDWKAWIGSAWLRQRVTLTQAEAAQAATLSLSAVDDVDQTFVNGVAVGGKNDPANPRSYPVPKGVLKRGVNEILIFVRNVWGGGGVAGPADRFALTFAEGRFKPLLSGWEYSRIAKDTGDPPNAPWDGPSGVSTLYNAMIAPLGSIGLKGVAWYQGEADVGNLGYERRLAAWMDSWRKQFRDPRLPFLIVGLAGWGKPVARPTESGWAALINEQRLGVERDTRTALVSAIDLGESGDIHPANKQEVGRRLALAAHQLAYGDKGALGPMPFKAQRDGSAIVVTFSKPLQALNGAGANAFELCGSGQGSCRYAGARVDGSQVVIALDDQPVTRVRYAWADYPVVNLYDLDLLPAPVFEMPVN